MSSLSSFPASSVLSRNGITGLELNQSPLESRFYPNSLLSQLIILLFSYLTLNSYFPFLLIFHIASVWQLVSFFACISSSLFVYLLLHYIAFCCLWLFGTRLFPVSNTEVRFKGLQLITTFEEMFCCFFICITVTVQ